MRQGIFLLIVTDFNSFYLRQEFGRSSIKFHEPQCERKRVAEDLRREKERREEGEENKVSYIDHIGEDIERLEAKGNKYQIFSSC